MKSKTLRTLIALTLATGVLSLGGCKSTPPPAPDAASSNGSPAAAPTPPAPGAVNSDGTPVATAPAPASNSPGATPAATATPPPAPAAPVAPPVLTAPRGTVVRVSITQTLAASKNEVGDGFTGVLSSPITSRGNVVFARGTRVNGTVIAAKGRGRFKGSGALGITLTSIGGMKVSSTEYEREAKGKGKRTGAFIGGGAGGGALIGGLAGGGKGALIGGLIGAGAGTAGAAYTGNKDVVIPSETIVTFTLLAPVSR
jgi:hypothetical protein